MHAFTHQPLHIFDANILAPLPNTLGYEENAIGSAVTAAPILWLTHNVVLASNVAMLLTIPLSGVGVFLLVRKLGLSDAAAFLAGLLFALEPPRFFRVLQFHVTAIQWIPFCLAYLHAYLDEGRRRDLWLALAFFSAQAITSGHGTTFLLVTILALLAFRFAFGEPIAPLKRLRQFGVVGALLLLPAVLMYLPYRRARAEAGLERDIVGRRNTAPSSFLATPSRIDGALLKFYPDWAREPPEAYLFPGYLPLAFVLLAPLVRGREEQSTRPASLRWMRRAAATADVVAALYGIGAAWFAWSGTKRLLIGDTVIMTVRQPWRLWLACAAAIAVRVVLARRVPFDAAGSARRLAERIPNWWRAQRRNAVLFYSLLALVAVAILPGPTRGLWQFIYWIPPLNFIRASLRFSLLAILGLAVLAGFALDRYTWRLSARGRWIVSIAVAALCVVEFSAIPLESVEAPNDIPAVDYWLATRPAPFTIAEVPLPQPYDDARGNAMNARYMVHSTAHFQKTVMGYSGLVPPKHAVLFDKLSSFPSRETLEMLLDDFGVNYVVVHLDFAEDEQQRRDLEQRIDQFQAWMTLEHADGDGRVYAIHRPR